MPASHRAPADELATRLNALSDAPRRRARSATTSPRALPREDRAGAGRYAAVVQRDGQAELVRGDDIDALLAHGALVALLDLDYDPR